MVEEFQSSSKVDSDNPWPGLYHYTRGDAAYFHGREAESDELFRRVRQKNLTVLFSQSGLGKSSLVRAGLFPRLQAEGFRPLVIRFTFGKDAPNSGETNEVPSVIEQCRRQFTDDLFLAGRADESTSSAAGMDLPKQGETLGDYFRRAGQFLDAHGRTFVPVLVFDQFEELFARRSETADGRQEVNAFFHEMADLVEGLTASAQRFRVLIALREDYLAYLENWRHELPSLVENRMRLTLLDGQGALRAVARPAALKEGREPLVDAAVSRLIVRFLARDGSSKEPGNSVGAWEDYAGFQVDPALLSLVLRELNDRRQEGEFPQITPELLRETGEVAGILEKFYDRIVADENPAVRVLVEEQLLTDTGSRDNMSVDRARRSLEEKGADSGALDRLVKRRLLRVVEERSKQRRLELAHDVLCPVLVERRRKRREDDEKRAAEETAQRAEARAVAAEAEKQKETAARVEARRLAGISGIVAALAIAALLFAFQACQESQKEKDEALRAKTAAEGLIYYLQYDLSTTLEKLGRLDIMDGVNARILKYQEEYPPQEGDLADLRERSVTLANRGDVLKAQGQSAEALRVYRESFAIVERLAKQRPENADWQNDLALAYGRVADALSLQEAQSAEALTAYREQLAIAERLTKQHPENADWQSDLYSGYNGVGDVLSAQGKPEEAMKAYREGLTIAEHFARQNPGDAWWLRNLSLSYERSGEVLRNQDQSANALDAYRKALAIAERFAKQDPDNVDWLRDIARLNERVGDVAQRQNRWPEAAEAFERELEITRPWLARAKVDIIWVNMFCYGAGSRWEVLRDAPKDAVKIDRAAAVADLRQAIEALKQIEQAGRLVPPMDEYIPWIEGLLSAEEAHEKAEKPGDK